MEYLKIALKFLAAAVGGAVVVAGLNRFETGRKALGTDRPVPSK